MRPAPGGCFTAPAPLSSAPAHSSVRGPLVCEVWPFDLAWGTSVDVETWTQVLPQNLFAASLFPYLGFLYHLNRATKATKAPGLVLFGFCFLLVFVGVSIPAGIYAKQVYGQALANVDWLHGSAEVLLTLTNLFVCIGLQRGIDAAQQQTAASQPPQPEEQPAAAPGEK